MKTNPLWVLVLLCLLTGCFTQTHYYSYSSLTNEWVVSTPPLKVEELPTSLPPAEPLPPQVVIRYIGCEPMVLPYRETIPVLPDSDDAMDLEQLIADYITLLRSIIRRERNAIDLAHATHLQSCEE